MCQDVPLYSELPRQCCGSMGPEIAVAPQALSGVQVCEVASSHCVRSCRWTTETVMASISCDFAPLQHVRPAPALGQVGRLALSLAAVWTLTCGGLTHGLVMPR